MQWMVVSYFPFRPINGAFIYFSGHVDLLIVFSGLPVTIRLLDPPLHEFLPEGELEDIVSELTSDTGMTEDEVFLRIEKLSEVNPMLGFRGCRFDFPLESS